MSDYGITLNQVDPDGGVQTTGPHNATQGEPFPEDQCGQSTGFDSVGYLYSNMKNNPDNIDQAKLIADCFVRKHIVDAGYSAQDYHHEMLNGTLYESGDEGRLESVLACQKDPTNQH